LPNSLWEKPGPIVNSKIILKVEICFKSKKATLVLHVKIGGVTRLGFVKFFSFLIFVTTFCTLQHLFPQINDRGRKYQIQKYYRP
jgi:hypothetical protein